MINLINQFFIYQIPSKEEKNPIESLQTKSIQLNIPSPTKSISQYQPKEHTKSSTKSIKTNNQRI